MRSLLLLAPLLARDDPVRLEHDPATGVAFDARSALAFELRTATSSFRIDGEESHAEQGSRHVVLARDLVWRDTFGPVERGRPLRIARRFLAVSGGLSTAWSHAPDRPDWASPLEGATVTFELDAERDAYDRASDDVDDELLAGLAADASARGLLPAEPVAAGASWPVDPAALRDVLVPLGDVALDSEMHELIGLGSYTGFTVPVVAPDPALWLDAFEGEIEATLVRVDDGGRAHVALRVDVRAHGDPSAWLLRTLLAQEHFDAEVERYRVDVDLEGEGTVVWDVAGGRLVELELDAAVELHFEAEWSLLQERRYDLDVRRTLEGELELETTLRPADS